MPWWPSCLDLGALINVDTPGFGMLVVRGAQVERFPRQLLVTSHYVHVTLLCLNHKRPSSDVE